MSKKPDRSTEIKRFALGAAVAAVAGYAAGILTAPKSGKETRAEIQHKATAGKLEAEKQLKKLHTQLGDSINEAKNRASDFKGQAKSQFDDATENATTAKEKVREVLSALHEGDADDKDLKKAIKDAQKAVDHLKTYFTKDFGKG
jgi:gas vesicle protein